MKFSKIKWPVYLTALLDTALVLVFTILPFVFGVFYLLLSSQYNGLGQFYQKGEFFLYALSLTVSSYLIYNQFKVRSSDLNSAFSKLSLLLLVLCSGFYAILSAIPSPDENVARSISIFLMCLAIPLFFYAQVVSNSKTSDVAEVRREEQQEIVDAIS
ncbi:MAG: hypothetical protein R2804_08840 [Cyclobacteriaceae bacterium]